MSTKRVGARGWVETGKLPRGPGGRALCRRCNQEVPKGRRSFCSETCVVEWKVRSDPGYVRKALAKRDKGICAICEADCRELARELAALQDYGVEGAAVVWEVRAALGIPWSRDTFWDADHTIPVVEGGGECGLDGYRTLCLVCHKDVTKALRARMKARRCTQPPEPDSPPKP